MAGVGGDTPDELSLNSLPTLGLTGKLIQERYLRGSAVRFNFLSLINIWCSFVNAIIEYGCWSASEQRWERGRKVLIYPHLVSALQKTHISQRRFTSDGFKAEIWTAEDLSEMMPVIIFCVYLLRLLLLLSGCFFTLQCFACYVCLFFCVCVCALPAASHSSVGTAISNTDVLCHCFSPKKNPSTLWVSIKLPFLSDFKRRRETVIVCFFMRNRSCGQLEFDASESNQILTRFCSKKRKSNKTSKGTTVTP